MSRAEELSDADRRFLTVSVPVAAFIGGLCCFTPVVVVLLGLGSISYAVALTDLLSYQYRWAFQLAALAFLLAALGVYLYRNEGVCSPDAAVRKRREIRNLIGLAVVSAVFASILWLYVIVELIGLAHGIW